MTPEQEKAYLADHDRCPFCGSPNLEGGDFDVNGDKVLQDIACLDCGQDWTDEYTLTGVG